MVGPNGDTDPVKPGDRLDRETLGVVRDFIMEEARGDIPLEEARRVIRAFNSQPKSETAASRPRYQYALMVDGENREWYTLIRGEESSPFWESYLPMFTDDHVRALELLETLREGERGRL